MTRTELIQLHDHLVTHYNAHGAEEAQEQISALEELLLASIAGNSSPLSLPRHSVKCPTRIPLRAEPG